MLVQFRYADCLDIVLIVIGTLASIGQGVMMPVVIVVFGGMIDLLVFDGQYLDWLNENWDTVRVFFPNSTVDDLADKQLIVV